MFKISKSGKSVRTSLKNSFVLGAGRAEFVMLRVFHNVNFVCVCVCKFSISIKNYEEKGKAFLNEAFLPVTNITIQSAPKVLR